MFLQQHQLVCTDKSKILRLRMTKINISITVACREKKKLKPVVFSHFKVRFFFFLVL